MTEKPIAALFGLGKDKCAWSGKEAEGAWVRFAGESETKFLSRSALWNMLRMKNGKPEETT